MKNLSDKWFHIFTAGKFEFVGPDGEIIHVTFTDKDVKDIADNYDPNVFESNLHIGHPDPEPEPPALGWINKLKADGGKLFCSFSHISKRALEISEEKQYKKCSVELGRIEGVSGKYLVGLGFTNYPRVADLPPFEFSAGSKLKTAPEVFLIDAINFSNHNNQIQNQMKISEVVEKFAQRIGLNVTEFASDTEVLDKAGEIISKLKDQFADDPEAVTSLSMYIDKYSAMPAKIKELEDQVLVFSNQQTENYINAAIADGKLLPSAKSMMLNFSKNSKPEDVKAELDKLPVNAMFKKDVVPVTGNEPGAPTDPKFKNADGSPLTFAQYSDKMLSRKPEDKKFIASFSMDEVKKLTGYPKES